MPQSTQPRLGASHFATPATSTPATSATAAATPTHSTASASKRAVKPARARKALHPERLFLVVALIFCTAFALLIPAAAGFDEETHLARAWQLAHGELLATNLTNGVNPQDDLYGGDVDPALHTITLANCANFQLGEGIGVQTYQFPAWTDSHTASDTTMGEAAQQSTFSNTAIYAPLVYAPYILGYWLCGWITNAYALIVVLRLFGVAAFIAAAYWCIKLAPFGRWPLTAFFLLPATMAAACMVNTDALNIVICVGFCVAVLRAALNRSTAHAEKCPELAVSTALKAAPPRTRQLVAIALLAAALALTKPTYIVLLALLALIPALNPACRSRRTMLPLVAIAAGAAVIFFAWYAVIHGINTGAMWERDIDPAAQASFILTHPFTFLGLVLKCLLKTDILSLGQIGVASAHLDAWRDTLGAPGCSGWLAMLTLCSSFLVRDPRDIALPTLNGPSIKAAQRWLFMICWGLFAACTLLICIAIYLQFCPVGQDQIDGVQPRYFLPLLPLLYLPIASYTAQHTPQQAGTLALRQPRGLLVALLILTALAALAITFVSIYV